MADKVLFADDEPSFRRLVRMFLEHERFSVLTAASGTEALELLGKHPDVAVVILDVMMPQRDGWETCRAIREFSDVPILMLTALDDERNEVFGLRNGADDYIAKPFGRELLVARVRALLRRSRGREPERLRSGTLELDPAAREVTVGGRRVALTPKEVDLLRYLLVNRDQVLSRRQILDAVWGYLYEGDPRTLDTHVKSLRARLGSAGAAIRTVRATGYCYREAQP